MLDIHALRRLASEIRD